MTFRGSMEQAKWILKKIPPFRSQSTAIASLVKFVRTKLAYNARIVSWINLPNVIPHLFSYLLVPELHTVFSTAVTNLKKKRHAMDALCYQQIMLESFGWT